MRDIGPRGWAWRIALGAVVLFLVWAGTGLFTLQRAVSDANDRVPDVARAALDEPDGAMIRTPTNILIVGSDARPGETRSRADTLMVMRLDPDDGKIKLLSIPRDFRVEIPGQGAQKINASFFFAGQRGAINAVKRLTGVPINHIMVIKFNGFDMLVDELGGVTVDNPTELVNCPYSGGTTVSFAKGDIDLNGEEALQFARVRRCDNDFQRALRQQALVSAMKDQVLSLSSVPFAPWRGAAVIDTMNTDLGMLDMLQFGWLQARLDQNPEDRILLTGTPMNIDGQSFVVGDATANEQEIAEFMS